jgi:diguanylate cyclase (GGDEF)-like protein/PAS domain S-box-containing protein
MPRKQKDNLDKVDLSAELEALKAEFALYRDAVESMHQGLCVFDGTGRIALTNHRYAEVVQLPRDRIQPGVTIRELVELGLEAGYYPPDSTAEQVEQKLWSNLREGSGTRTTLTRGGRTYTSHPCRTASGNWVATFEETTVQVETERALRDSEARMKAMLDAMPDCVKIFDEAGRLIHINPAGLELLQAPDLESLGTPGYIPIPPEYLDASLDVHRRVMAGESVVWSYEVLGMEGRRRHVEAHAVPFLTPAGSKGQLCISRDIEDRQQAHQALQRSEERLRLVQEATGLADFEATPGMIAQISDALIEQTGLPAGTSSLTFEEWIEVVHPDDRALFTRNRLTNSDNDETGDFEFRIVRPDNGETRWIHSRTRLKRDAAGKLVGSIGAHLDITERKLAEEALRESEERLRLVQEATGLADFEVRSDGMTQLSERFVEQCGLPPGTRELHQDEWMPILHPDDHDRMEQEIIKSLERDDAFQCEFRIIRPDNGEVRWISSHTQVERDAAGKPTRTIGGHLDITERKNAEEALRESEERFRLAARHDALTKLANRGLFQERLDLAIREAISDGGSVGLLLLDLDDFKQVNDTFGHDAGDMLLQMFAERLRGVIRSQDTVARFGGDEFAVVMPDIHTTQSVIQLSRSIQERLREPFVHEGRMLDCRVSMGASVFPMHGRTSEELLKNADVALYAAKASGRGMVSLFEPHMRDDVQQRISMVQLARNAIRDDRVVPYYQPKLDLGTRSVVGFEALLRWRTPRGRIALPGMIEAAFDDLEVAAAISDRMIERVIADMRGWLDRGIDFKSVAVNASAAEFRLDNFAERVLEQLSSAGIPTRYFQLEVTETVFLGRGAEYVHRALALLNARGVKIALDDFGTGYASLRHLKQFPVDIIKIDKSFVHDMTVDPGDEAIIHAVVNLGRNLGISVVAEGIETEEQERRLIEVGCEFGQGFLFSRAVPANRVPGLVERWPARPVAVARGLRLVAHGS